MKKEYYHFKTPEAMCRFIETKIKDKEKAFKYFSKYGTYTGITGKPYSILI